MTHDIEPAVGCETYRLQDLLLSNDMAQRAIYWRKVDAAGNHFHDTDGAEITRGITLSLDTFLNSFYERYWRDLTELPSLSLSIKTSGCCRIRVVRRSARHRDTVVTEAIGQGEQTRSVLQVSFASLPIADAVLHVEIEAKDDKVVFHEASWETTASPRNEIRLAIVTCSYGRETMLVENLRRIRDVVASHPAILRVLVINQGPLPLEAFAPYAALNAHAAFAKKLQLIRQSNFGGTGGFARGLLETLDSSATHVLLLDDDIDIEPWVLERLVALLSRLVTPTTIGGQMLDLHKPTILHASHENVRLDVLELKNSYMGVDLAKTPAARLFARRQMSDYNAWWFCCFPMSAVREIGMPIPMFIRHDDVEFGIRAVAAGVPVMTMPGIFVWHEPFTKKAKALTVYYDHRNFMIAATLHRKIRRIRFMLMHWRDAWGALRRHRFEYCWARCRAVEDFLKGPVFNFVDMKGRHRDLISAQAHVTLMTMASVRYHADAKRRRRMRWRLSVARVLLFGRRGLAPQEAAFASTIRDLVFAIVRSSAAFLWNVSRAEAAYRAEMKTFTSAEYWRASLGLSREAP